MIFNNAAVKIYHIDSLVRLGSAPVRLPLRHMQSMYSMSYGIYGACGNNMHVIAVAPLEGGRRGMTTDGLQDNINEVPHVGVRVHFLDKAWARFASGAD